MIQMTSNAEPAGRAPRAGSQQTRALRAGETLFMQGDDIRSVCILRDGWAFRYQCLEDGRRQIVDFVLPGEIVGIESSRHAQYGVEALSACTWIVIPREVFLGNLSRQPSLSMQLLDMVTVAQM